MSDLYRDRLVALAEKWETAARAETEADTFRNGFLSGQNWAAGALRAILWDVECAAGDVERDREYLVDRAARLLAKRNNAILGDADREDAQAVVDLILGAVSA
jgi:hypothetical protein